MTAAVTPYASRTGRRPRTTGYVRGRQSSGYRFGPGRFIASAPLPEKGAPIIVPAFGVNVTTAGYELIAGDEVIAWRECILDAIDLLKAHRGPGKVVRCRDRALMKSRA